jgi:hypothetical protein
VLEEAAYVEPGFFYETVAPLLLIGNTSLIAISTLTSEINFYTRLLRMRDKVSGLPLFTSISVQLACRKCIEDGKAAACVHMLHLVPRWQSSDRHVKLKTIMQARAIFFMAWILFSCNCLFPRRTAPTSSRASSAAWPSTRTNRCSRRRTSTSCSASPRRTRS